MSETGDTRASSDVVSRMAAYGLGVPNDLSNVRPFRLSTMPEILLTRLLTVRDTGLEPEQFAMNPWGFPAIPFPEDRGSTPERLLLAPTNATISAIGHPIYWIDPVLTRPTEDEVRDSSRWCVRMFYLIMGFGLWDTSDLSWIGGPTKRGLKYSHADYQNYMNGESSALDDVRYGSEDLRIPYEAILRRSAASIEQMGDLQERAWREFRTEQVTAYGDAVHLLGEESGWTPIEEDLRDLSVTVARAVRDHSTLQPFIKPTYEATARLVALLNDIEKTTVVLAAPVLRDQSYDTGVYSRAVTLLRAYNDQVVDGGYQKQMDALVDAMFRSNGLADPLSFARLHEKASAFQLDAWRRLKLATVNFVRRERGEQPYASYDEYQTVSFSRGDEDPLSIERSRGDEDDDEPTASYRDVDELLSGNGR